MKLGSRLLASMAGLALGCSHFMPPAPAYLDIFDCLIPVPSGYAFNTADSSTTHAYSAAPRRRDWGDLNVWNYDGPVPLGRYEILTTRRRGRLLIEEIRLRGAEDPSASLIVVTDGVRKLSLEGEARDLVDSMVDACLASSR